MTLPDTRVEIAFDSKWSTPAAERTWTDVSDFVELQDEIGITHGRGDEFAKANPNVLNLVLDNRDGRFSPNREWSPYYPNVKIGRPIRVTMLYEGEPESHRFTGYVDEWPNEWDGTAAQAFVAITATSRMARINGSPLAPLASHVILAESPTAYWPLTEEKGAAYGLDAVTPQGPRMVPHLEPGGEPAVGRVSFGGDPVLPTDSAPSVMVPVAGPSLRAYNVGPVDNTVPLSMMIAFQCRSEDGLAYIYPVLFRNPENSEVVTAFITEKQLWVGISYLDSTGSPAGAYTMIPLDISPWDGQPHVMGIIWTGGTIRVNLFRYSPEGEVSGGYVGGITLAAHQTLSTVLTDVQLCVTVLVTGTVDEEPTANIGRAAIWVDRWLSDEEIAALAEPMLVGYPEDTGARIERVAGYAGIAASEVDADADGVAVTHVDIDGRTPLAVMRVVEDTEGGVLFDARDGDLGFRSRAGRYTAPVAFTLDVEDAEVGVDFAPRYDRTLLQNDVTVSSGQTKSRYYDQDSIDDYGPSGDSIEIASPRPDAAIEAASWRVNTYSEPKPRVPAVTVDLQTLDPAKRQAILDAEIGTRFVVANLPGQAEGLDADYFIEGWGEQIGVGVHSITFNVSDATPLLQTFVLDDPLRGVLDSDTYVTAY